MKQTVNYKLNKPDATDVVDIDALNQNMDTLDTEVAKKAAGNHVHNYAGAASAGGAANTATKLATARKINGVAFDGSADITAYTHPTTHPATMITEDATHRFMTDAERSKLTGIAAGAQVNTITGVKGAAESSYRTGNVNLTAANIGAAATTHNHTKSQITDMPTSLPANGGNADTVDGKHASDFVYKNNLLTENMGCFKSGETILSFANSMGSKNAVKFACDFIAHPSDAPVDAEGFCEVLNQGDGGARKTIRWTCYLQNNKIYHRRIYGGEYIEEWMDSSEAACHVAIQSGAPDTGKLWAW